MSIPIMLLAGLRNHVFGIDCAGRAALGFDACLE